MDYRALLDDFITTLMRENGSDLHLSVGRVPTIRASGQLLSLVGKEPFSRETILGILSVVLGEEKLRKFVETQEIDFAYDYKDEARLRGNAFFQKGSVSISLRLIPKVKSLSELQLPDTLASFARKKQGLFLIVGPVGQGKSTTMASLVNMINEERNEHIITVEDPIEYVFVPKNSLIDQREVGIDTHDFPSALKSVFRQDANVIMIGEMRSADTMSAAVTAAETGHLVFSTLHTNNALQTIDRIIDGFPSGQQDQVKTQLANSLIGIFSQRLIPRVSGGLVPAFELLVCTPAVANLIREGRTHEIEVVIETGQDQGMIDMNRCLIDLVRKGEISMENAYLYSLNPKALERLF
jgi:twitching motility protein PilT